MKSLVWAWSLYTDMRATAGHARCCADLVAAISKTSCIDAKDMSVFEDCMARNVYASPCPAPQERVFVAFFGFCTPELLALLLRAVEVYLNLLCYIPLLSAQGSLRRLCSSRVSRASGKQSSSSRSSRCRSESWSSRSTCRP